VLRRRGAKADPVSDDDVRRALSKLKALGGGLDLVAIGAASYVRSVPGELNLDKNAALALAQARGGVAGRGWGWPALALALALAPALVLAQGGSRVGVADWGWGWD
jgi:hypothetical protein